MAKIIKERKRIEYIEYELEFLEVNTNQVHFGFPLLNGKGTEVVPCKPGKEVNTYEPCSQEECTWWENYLYVKNNNKYYSREGFFKNSWIEPAHAICECGKEIMLSYDAEECEYCGRLHNLCGQELKPREYWEEDY